jgi:flagellar biosynthesis protein FlhA
VDAGAVEGAITGIETTDPATGRRARWIEPAQQEAAKALGYVVHSPQTFIVQALAEVVRSHSEELLTRQHVHALLADLRSRLPQLVDELIPHPLKTAHVHQVLSNLLRERVPIRDLETIVGTLADHADRTRNVVLLTEAVRTALARTICQACRDERRRLHAITLDPALEDELAEAIDVDEAGIRVRLSNAASNALVAALRDPLARIAAAGHAPTVVCRAEVRAGLRSITSRALPRASILGLHEITQDTELVLHAEVSPRALLDPTCVPAGRDRTDGPSARAFAAGRMSIPIHEPVLT